MVMASSSALVTAYAKLQGKDFVKYLTKPEVTLGRNGREQESAPDIELGESKAISRAHAKIGYNREAARFEIVCLSKNGLFLDGRYLSCYYLPAPLDSGSLIQIGSVLFYFLLPTRVVNGSLKGVEITLPKGKPEKAKWTNEELEAICKGMISYGFDNWQNLHKLVPARSQHSIKFLSRKILATLIDYTGVSDPETASKLAKILREAQPAGVASTPPMEALKDWKLLEENAVPYARRIVLLNAIRKAVQTYGETAVLDGVPQISGQAPSTWWTRMHDVDLLRGIIRHGFGSVEAIIADEELIFFSTMKDEKTGVKYEWPPAVQIGLRLREILTALSFRNAKYSRKSRRRRTTTAKNAGENSSSSRKRSTPAGNNTAGHSDSKPSSKRLKVQVEEEKTGENIQKIKGEKKKEKKKEKKITKKEMSRKQSKKDEGIVKKEPLDVKTEEDGNKSEESHKTVGKREGGDGLKTM